MSKILNSGCLVKQNSKKSIDLAMTKEISCSLGSLVCFVAFAWLALIYPISDFHADTIITFGFAPMNLKKQIIGAVYLILIGLSIRILVPEFKLLILKNILIAGGFSIIPILGFLMLLHELAIFLFLFWLIFAVSLVSYLTNATSKIYIILATVLLYTSFNGLFFIEVFLFYEGVEHLLVNSLFITTYVVSYFTLINVPVCLIDQLSNSNWLIKDARFFNEVLVFCLVVSWGVFYVLDGILYPKDVFLSVFLCVVSRVLEAFKKQTTRKE